MRVVARDGSVVVDETTTLPGRGAWLCPSRECLDRAVSRRAFRRALRLSAEPDTAPVQRYYEQNLIDRTG